MEDKKVLVESLVDGRIGVEVPDLRLRRVWEKKGVKKSIKLEDLKEAIYDPGVEYMFRQGILGVDEATMKEIGLLPNEEESEYEDVGQPQIIALNDSQRKRLMTVAPFKDFKDTVDSLPHEQVSALVDYAIDHELTNGDKCTYLKDKTGRDIFAAIQLEKKDKEVVKVKEA